ncbi:MAG: acetate--CoA ligase family protein [Ardenticatenaceae bacterium]
MTQMDSLQRLLRPANIAVVGGREGAEVIRQCERIGFQGEIWPVNPRRERIAGRVCYASVMDLPEAPDATFIAIPRQYTIGVVAALAERGAGGAVCYASGFAEVGGEGVLLQEQLLQAMGEVALVGPNCYGLLNYLDGVALWPDQHGGRQVEKGVAIISQSGNIGLNLTMQQRGLELAYLITVGNQAGVATHEYVEALLEDERVTAIGLQLEGLSDVAAFSRAAIKALAKKVPIVVLKSGSSELGRQIALSHTSSMVGADGLYDALFERVGIMRVHTLPQLMEALKFLSVVGPMPSRKIASISCSGGEAGLVADLADSLGLSMPPLIETQRQELHAVLGDKVPLSNPLDYHTYIWADEEAQYRCFSAMMLGTQDITLKMLDYPRADLCDDSTWIITARAFSRGVADRGTRGAVVSTLQENLPPEARKTLLEQGTVPMQGLEECLLAIRGAAHIYQKQQCYAEIEPLADTPPHNAQVITLDEAQSKQIMRDYGIPTPNYVICTAEEAAQAAQEIGFPVVVKVLSDQIIHKSDVGGVHLNLRTPEAVQQAVDGMRALSERFLVEAMAPRPVAELIVGLTRDPQFGLVLLVGAGGVLAEVLQDHATLLFPVNRAEVEEALASLKIASILNGYRGNPPADKAAIVDAVMGLARFAEEHAAEVVEIDLNPVFALPKGQGVLAVDAIIRLAP